MSEKKSKDTEQVNVRMSLEILAEIDDFVQNSGPTMRKAIEGSSVLPEGKSHGSSRHAFIAYAIRNALKKENPQTVGRTFGTKIETTVLEIMDRNIVAHDNGEWWKIQTIGLSVLRDAGHNHNSCTRWLSENLTRLMEHYASVGIPAEEVQDWNRKAGRYRASMKSEEQ